MSFQKVLDKYRKLSFSERDKGDRFERLMQAYLQTDPKYAPRFKKVWLWNEFPGKLDLGGGDTGIDLVALTHEGDYWAIQCKCYQAGSVIDKPAVDSFLSTSSREFKNEKMQTTRFAHRRDIAGAHQYVAKPLNRCLGPGGEPGAGGSTSADRRLACTVGGCGRCAGRAGQLGAPSRSGPRPLALPSPLIGRAAPAFELASIDGRTVDSGALRGKPRVGRVAGASPTLV